MRHWIAIVASDLIPSSPKHPPPPFVPTRIVPSPEPTTITIVRYVHISTPTGRSGLNTAFLVLLLFLLVGIAAWIIWMFATGRWVSAKADAAHTTRMKTWQVSVSGPQTPKSLPGVQEKHWTLENAGANIGPKMSQPEDPLKNKRWITLAEGCTELFDELDGLFPRSDPRQEVAIHIMHRVQEILKRSGVEVIARDRVYDLMRHQVIPPDPSIPPGASLARIISPGFAIGNRVLRPAKVEVITPSASERQVHHDN